MGNDNSTEMTIHLKIWKQDGPGKKGEFISHEAKGLSSEMSFLEMLDVVNEDLVRLNQRPIEFDHDCREGICGTCSMVINGEAHGPDKEITTCQLHMRKFKDGDTITVEPFRAKAFPIIRDLVVDRSSFDRVIESGGYVSVNTGGAQDANSLPINKPDSDLAFEAATCIGCGACVASCKNASASLFVSAKLAHLSFLPQGKIEQDARTLAMVRQMDTEGFGACTNTEACEAACPKGISVENISRMNRQFLKASIKER
jgi:succinate dehydrogenase / fumarate reductase, iron-sulfur subunit